MPLINLKIDNQRLLNSILLIMIIYIIPMTLIYINNSVMFLDITFKSLLVVLLLSFLFLSVIAYVVKGLISRIWIGSADPLITFMVAIWFTLYMSIFVWKFMLLDGTPLYIGDRIIYVIIEFLVLIILSALIYMKREFIQENLIMLLSLTILFLLVSNSHLYLYFNYADFFKRGSPLRFDIEHKSLYSFSSDKNYVLIILDMAQTDTYYKIINADSNIRQELNGFVFYINSLARFSHTRLAIPSLICGKSFNGENYFDYIKEVCADPIRELKEKNIFSSLAVKYPSHIFLDNNWENAVSSYYNYVSSFKNLFTLYLYKMTPLILKNQIYKDGTLINIAPAIKNFGQKLYFFRDTSRKEVNKIAVKPKTSVNRLITNKIILKARAKNKFDIFDTRLHDLFIQRAHAGSPHPTYKIFHLRGPHPPWTIDSNFQKNSNTTHYEQGYAIMGLVISMLEKLKEIGVYNNSAIFIVGDHGSSLPQTKFDYSFLSQFGIKYDQAPVSKAFPLLLFKNFTAAEPLTISKLPVSLVDISKFIFSKENIKNSFQHTDPKFSFSQPGVSRSRLFTQKLSDSLRHRGGPQFKGKLWEVSDNPWLKSSWKLLKEY